MEVVGAQVGNGVPKTVVAAVTAAFLELGRAGRQVEFIMGDKNLFGGNLEKVRQGFDCGAAAVHKGAGVQQVQVEALPLNAGIQPVVLLFGAQRLARIAGQRFDEQGAGVVAGILVVGTGVPQSNHHDNILCHSPLPPELLLLAAFLAFGFLGVVRLGTLRLVDRGNRQVVVFALLQRRNTNAFRQFQVAQVNHLIHLYVRQVDFDEFRQVLRQTRNFNFRHQAESNATEGLDGRSGVFVEQVNRYLNNDFVVFVNALEVSVGQQQFVWVALQIFQDNAFFLALNVDGQDVREEGFVFEGLFQLVVPDGYRSCVFAATVDDGRDFTLFATQAAARTSPLIVTRKCFNYEFLGHGMYLVIHLNGPRPGLEQMSSLKGQLSGLLKESGAQLDSRPENCL